MINKIKNAIKLLIQGKFDLFWFKLLRKLGVKDMVPPLPFTLLVEPVNYCNLRCPLCPTGSGRLNRKPELMSFDRFKYIIDQVRGYVNKMFLFNYGEPLLNDEVFKMAKYATDAGINVKMSTNAQLLDKQELCDGIIESKLKHFIISLDGLDQETLEQYRVGANYENEVNNIKMMMATKKKANSKLPKIELQFLVMKHNEHQKERMEEFAKELGVDIFAAKTIFLYDTPDMQLMAKKFLPNDQKFSRYEKDENDQFILKGKITNHCDQVLGVAAINVNGDVVPCCYDLFSQYIMGNVFETSLKKIWKGSRYNKLRNQINTNRGQNRMCSICPENRIEFINERKQLKNEA